MARITNKEILSYFIECFEGDKPFTPSEHRMNGIKLAQLKKNVKAYITDNDVETDKSVEQIILDAIKYAKMIGMKFRSVASLGYDILPKSIEFWKKREKLLEKKEKELKEKEKNEEKTLEKVIEKSYNNNIVKEQVKRKPKWFGQEDQW